MSFVIVDLRCTTTDLLACFLVFLYRRLKVKCGMGKENPGLWIRSLKQGTHKMCNLLYSPATANAYNFPSCVALCTFPATASCFSLPPCSHADFELDSHANKPQLLHLLTGFTSFVLLASCCTNLSSKLRQTPTLHFFKRSLPGKKDFRTQHVCMQLLNFVECCINRTMLERNWVGM